MKRHLAILLILADCGEASEWNEFESIEQLKQKGEIIGCSVCIESENLRASWAISRFQLPKSEFHLSGSSLPELGVEWPEFEFPEFGPPNAEPPDPELPPEPAPDAQPDEESESHWKPRPIAPPYVAPVVPTVPKTAITTLLHIWRIAIPALMILTVIRVPFASIGGAPRLPKASYSTRLNVRPSTAAICPLLANISANWWGYSD